MLDNLLSGSTGSSRRNFLATAGALGVGLISAPLLGKTIGSTGGLKPSARAGSGNVNFAQARSDFPGIPGQTINQLVLNFALTLEFLEADLYRQALNAISGRSIDAPLESDSSKYELKVGRGGLPRIRTNAGFLYLAQFAYVEAAHRDFLINAITNAGATPTTAATAGYSFPNGPGTTLREVLANILPLEETGVRAYLGALPYLTDLGLATTAGGIYSTECRHSAAIAYTLGQTTGPAERPGDLKITRRYPTENTFEYALAPSSVLTAASVYFN